VPDPPPVCYDHCKIRVKTSRPGRLFRLDLHFDQTRLARLLPTPVIQTRDGNADLLAKLAPPQAAAFELFDQPSALLGATGHTTLLARPSRYRRRNLIVRHEHEMTDGKDHCDQ
jgi:hypothetical protein